MTDITQYKQRVEQIFNTEIFTMFDHIAELTGKDEKALQDYIDIEAYRYVCRFLWDGLFNFDVEEGKTVDYSTQRKL